MILLGKWQGINPMGLGATLSDYKNNNSSEKPSFNQNLKMSHQNIAKD